MLTPDRRNNKQNKQNKLTKSKITASNGHYVKWIWMLHNAYKSTPLHMPKPRKIHLHLVYILK